MNSRVRSIFGWCVVLTLCIAPTQWAIIKNPRLGLADLLLLLSAGLWGLDVLLKQEWQRLWRARPHWTHLLFVVCAGASVAVAADRAEALKELLQLMVYFVVGAMVFKAFLTESLAPTGAPRATMTPKTLFFGLAASLTVVLILSAIQYSVPGHASTRLFVEPKALDIILHVLGGQESRLLVGGTFGNGNVLGGYLALTLPFCMAALMLPGQRWWVRFGCLLFLITGLGLLLAGAAYWAIVVVLLTMAAVRGARWLLPLMAALLLWQCEVLPRLPRENDLRHYESLALYSESGTPTRRYPEWQAAWNVVLTHPWLGVGLGNYQREIGQYYDQIPNATGPSEPDIQNLYLVVAASCGLPALLAWMALLTVSAAIAVRSGKAGAAGAIAAFALTAIWHPLLVRGIGLPLVFALVLAQMERCVGSELHEKRAE